MGSERRRRAITLAAAMGMAVIALVTASAPARAAVAWWSPVSLRGLAVTRVSAIGATITVRTGSGATLTSTDGGKTFAAAAAGTTLPSTNVVTIGAQRWEIDSGGRVAHVSNVAQRSTAVPDPSSPDLGAGADLIAAPAALPGVVVAVSTDGTVWRRGQDGDWKQALLLLPASAIQGVPRITSVTAFTPPLSDAIYLGTDGYAVLISTDGVTTGFAQAPGSRIPCTRSRPTRLDVPCMRARPTDSGSTCCSRFRRHRPTTMRRSSGDGSGSARSH